MSLTKTSDYFAFRVELVAKESLSKSHTLPVNRLPKSRFKRFERRSVKRSVPSSLSRWISVRTTVQVQGGILSSVTRLSRGLRTHSMRLRNKLVKTERLSSQD